VCVIKDNKTGSPGRVACLADNYSERITVNCRYSIPVILFSFLVLAASLLLGSSQAAAEAASIIVPVESVAQIRVDDDGNALGYPIGVFYDPVMDETYVVNADTGRVVVYGPDFFPFVSIGIGRGVAAPRGGAVMSNGDVYITQIRSAKSKSNRISIYNGAFFLKREIFLDDIKQAKRLTPIGLAVSSEGIIYVVGNNFRGVLVLDEEGNFLRLLQPMDEIPLRAIKEAEIQAAEEERLAEQEQPLPAEDIEAPKEEENLYLDIPEEFRPGSNEDNSTSWLGKGLGAVRINFVTIDSTGKIYLLSAETSKIYVYGPDENFLFSFGEKGGSPRQLSQPISLAIDEERGLIYVVDYQRHTILTYDLTGKYLFEIGGRGIGPGWFNFPISITINNSGQIIVADLFNKRVQVLDVRYDEVADFLKDFTAEPKSEGADAAESTQDEPSPGIHEDIPDQEDQPDASLEQMYQTIKEEKKAKEEESTPAEEVILDEEIIEEAPHGQNAPPGPFDEPLETPE